MVKWINILERFVTNSIEEIEWFDQMGIELKLNYAYVETPFIVDEIVNVKPYKGSKIECVVYLNTGYKTVCYGNADDLFIKINDLKNNEIEDEQG